MANPDWLAAFGSVLEGNDALYDMVDGEIHVGLAEEDVSGQLDDGAHRTCVTVNYPEAGIRAGQGSAVSRIVQVRSRFHVNVFSRQSQAYAGEVMAAIVSLVALDVSATVDGVTHLFILGDMPIAQFKNSDKQCYQASAQMYATHWERI